MTKKIIGLLLVFLFIISIATATISPSYADGCDIPANGEKPPIGCP